MGDLAVPIIQPASSDEPPPTIKYNRIIEGLSPPRPVPVLFRESFVSELYRERVPKNGRLSLEMRPVGDLGLESIGTVPKTS